MRVYMCIGLLLILLFSCQKNEKVVYILFDNSEGLGTGNDVLLNGVSVGKVLNVDLTEDNQVITTVELSKTVDFPKGSAFEIQSKDVFTKFIHVDLNDSKVMIEGGDTIYGVFRDPPPQTPHETRTPDFVKNVKEMLKN